MDKVTEYLIENMKPMPQPFTRREYLMLKLMEDGRTPWYMAIEAIASTAIEHPEWDMEEAKTLSEWERG
jgi:hypothetical protein